jgi:hypothetical protein
MHDSSSVTAALWLAHLSPWQWPTLDQWEKLAKIAAVVLGGAWVLMHYWRGRTFKSRLELAVSADVQKLDGRLQVTGKVVAKNIGLSKIALENLGSGIQYSLYKQDSTSADGVTATELDFATDVFKDHEWIEPGETVSDEFFSVIVADDSVIALKLRVNQLGRPQTWGRRKPKKLQAETRNGRPIKFSHCPRSPWKRGRVPFSSD